MEPFEETPARRRGTENGEDEEDRSQELEEGGREEDE